MQSFQRWIQSYTKNDLTYGVLHDAYTVLTLLNHHGPQGGNRVTCKGFDGHCHQSPAPTKSDYQSIMKGVDLCDQVVGYYMS